MIKPKPKPRPKLPPAAQVPRPVKFTVFEACMGEAAYFEKKGAFRAALNMIGFALAKASTDTETERAIEFSRRIRRYVRK